MKVFRDVGLYAFTVAFTVCFTGAPILSANCPGIITVNSVANLSTCIQHMECPSFHSAATEHSESSFIHVEVSTTIPTTLNIRIAWEVIQPRDGSSAVLICETSSSPCLVRSGTQAPITFRDLTFQGLATPFIKVEANAFLILRRVSFEESSYTAIGLPAMFSSNQVLSSETFFANITSRPDATEMTCRHASLCLSEPYVSVVPSPSASLLISPSASPSSFSASPSASQTRSILVSQTATPSMSSSVSLAVPTSSPSARLVSPTPSLTTSPSSQSWKPSVTIFSPSSTPSRSPATSVPASSISPSFPAASASSSPSLAPHQSDFSIGVSLWTTAREVLLPVLPLPQGCGAWLCLLEQIQGKVKPASIPIKNANSALCAAVVPSPSAAPLVPQPWTLRCWTHTATVLVHEEILIIPPTRWLLSSISRTKVSSNDTILRPTYVENDPILGSGWALFLHGNDTLISELPAFDWLASVPLLSTPEVSLAKVECSNASIQLAHDATGALSNASALLPLSLTSQSLEIGFPNVSVLETLCSGAAGACALQLTWTLGLVLSHNVSELPTHLFHTQSCPPDCIGVKTGGLIAYSDQCPGYYSGAACFDFSQARNRRCAFGSPPQCRLCPEHAACPGGFRAWPGPGYWAADENLGVVYGCRAPATTRCTGWSISERRSGCGPGYDPNVPLCGACLQNFYSQDGVCTHCSTSDSITQGVGAIGILFASLGSMLVVLIVIFSRAFTVTGLPVTRALALRIAVEVMLWVISTLQVFIQLTRTITPGLPGWVRGLFSFVQAVESDITGLVPSGCNAASPFLYTNVLCILSLVTAAVFATLAAYHLKCTNPMSHSSDSRGTSGTHGRRGSIRHILGSWTQFICSVIVIQLYGPALAKSLDAANCVDASRAIATENGVEILNFSVWALDTRFACREGDHLSTFVLAYFVMFLVGFGLPLLIFMGTLFHLRQVQHTHNGLSFRRPAPISQKKRRRARALFGVTVGAASCSARFQRRNTRHCASNAPGLLCTATANPGFAQCPFCLPSQFLCYLLCSRLTRSLFGAWQRWDRYWGSPWFVACGPV